MDNLLIYRIRVHIHITESMTDSKDGCATASQCNGCKKFCTDDKMMMCDGCHSIGFCNNCALIPESMVCGWYFVCKRCTGFSFNSLLKQCVICDKFCRKIYKDDVCFDCHTRAGNTNKHTTHNPKSLKNICIEKIISNRDNDLVDINILPSDLINQIAHKCSLKYCISDECTGIVMKRRNKKCNDCDRHKYDFDTLEKMH
jgi:hypothetical protein